MTVVDIRNIFSKRNIEIFEVSRSFIYYAEEKNDGSSNELFILEYNRATRRERLITNYTLEDPTFVEHIFSFSGSIVIILENGGNSLWLIEIDKKTGSEINRRKVVCTGAFRSCCTLDEDHILIYMGPDEENSEMFRQYKEMTGNDTLCYLYDLRTNTKTFVKNRLIAKLSGAGIRIMDVHGIKNVILLDPFADEEIKKGYYDEQRWINADIRDNIWLCDLNDLIRELEQGSEEITKKCIASADIKALARYMGIAGDKMYFRAKEFRTGNEKLCSYDVFTNSLRVECDLALPEDENTVYIIEEDPFTVFTVSTGKDETIVRGVVNSTAGLRYKSDLGGFVTCIENRYAIATRAYYDEENELHSECTVYDSENGMSETYECSCYIKNNTLVIY